MPRSNWIDKKTATHFTLVHRPQNDPLIHDESAPSMVLNPTQLPNAHKVKNLGDLASELGSDAQHVRGNEGEAAEYGVYFDDTEYDYMQHLRDLGAGGNESVFIEAHSVLNQAKGKQQQSLDQALRELDLTKQPSDILDKDFLPSENLQRLTYQSQQNVPDAIAGFQPDMDPRLREVLEALEDDAYVDDDEDIFQALAKDAEEVDQHEFEDLNDDDGYTSDHTAKPTKEYNNDEVPPQLVHGQAHPAQGSSQDWMEDFRIFKKEQKTEKKVNMAPSEIQSSICTATTNGGAKKKKRKGALTNPSTYSMTSSSLVRTEKMSILDARFEKIEEEYQPDMDDTASVSVASTASAVTGPTRADFDGMLDDFLGSYSSNGKKRSKEGKYKSGLEQLDEIRRELGPARIRRPLRS